MTLRRKMTFHGMTMKLRISGSNDLQLGAQFKDVN